MRRMVFALTIGLVVCAGPALARDVASDQQVAQKIADSYKQSGKLKGYSIGVSYKEGVARLEGWVRNSEQMERAVEITRQSPEVADVVNELTVLADPSVTRAAPGKPQAFLPASLGNPIEEQVSEEQVEPAGEEAAPAVEEASPAEIDRVASVPVESEKTALKPAAYPGQPRMNRQSRPGMLPRQNGRTQQGQPVGQQVAPQGAPQAQLAAQQQQMQQQRYAMMQPQGGQPPVGAPRGGPMPAYVPGSGGGVAAAVYDQPNMPNYAWPSYAAYPNYGAVTYPKQYSPTAWPYIGPFYPYPQVPLNWRQSTLEWKDGTWNLRFSTKTDKWWWFMSPKNWD